VIPHANGIDSYDIPFLETYLDSGIIDISVHGDTHAVDEFDTAKSGRSFEQLKAGLIKARDQFQQHFGFAPVAFTVPNDFFDKDGYQAAQDA
jgi:hypothetical protein